jgi:membrane-bound metal-dependent hydrolase YbcI (DUF457 family)
MFLGHFGLALAAKKAAPKASLGLFVVSAQFADLLWPILLLLGIEQVRIAPGITRVTPFDFVSYPYSHSLLMELVWGFLLAALYFLWRRDLRTATVLGLLLPTHWLLDYFAHRPDMPLYPRGPKYGLGMWNSLPLTVLVEYGIFIAGLMLYLSATRPRPRRNYAFWSLIIFLAAIYPASVFGPPPPDVHTIAFSALALWLTVPWAAWADRHPDQEMSHAS